MALPPPLLPLPPDLGARLHAAMMAMPGRRHAVVDGVRDPDLRGRLDGLRLTAKPLYLENRSDIDIWAGPVLVDIAEQAAADRFVAGLPTGWASVFWGWPADMASLHRHLRSINMAVIPPEADAAQTEPEASAGEGDPGGGDRVLFRHYDPDALAPVLPVLRPDQVARLLGDALAILCVAEDYGGVLAYPRPQPLPADPGGVLRLDAAQMDAVEANWRAASRNRIARFLREGLPDETAGLDREALLRRVQEYERQARFLGLSSERDIARWAFLELTLGDVLFADEDLRASFSDGRQAGTPSEHLEALYDATIDELEHGG